MLSYEIVISISLILKRDDVITISNGETCWHEVGDTTAENQFLMTVEVPTSKKTNIFFKP